MFNRHNCFLISILITTFSAVMITTLGQENMIGKERICSTPKNESGICTYLENCKELLDLVVKLPNVLSEDREYLKKSQCGFDPNQEIISRKVMVCCPNDPDISARVTKEESSSVTIAESVSSTAGNELPNYPVCGRDFSNRIYGGNVTQIDEFPWMALLQYRKSKLYFGFHCGGSLINSRYVLTAAHCIMSPDMPPNWEIYAVRLGEWDLETDVDCEIYALGNKDCALPHRDITIEKSIVHESYVPGSPEQYFDIALLRLSQSVEPYNDFVRPICLPIDATLRNPAYNGVDMTISGWGTTETATSSKKKLKAVIPSWNEISCAEKYLTYNIHINTSQQICAGAIKGIDACRGDSGGPLMVKEMVEKRYVYFSVGIVSFGPRPCGLSGWPGVYTRTGYYIDWIMSKLEA